MRAAPICIAGRPAVTVTCLSVRTVLPHVRVVKDLSEGRRPV
jgi:hypothetical protein